MSRRYQAAILTASYNGLQVPNAPTIGTATAGSGTASVTFTAPANVGGGAITSYTVISSPGSVLGTGASSPITVSGLTNDTAYTFTVVATNAYGSGPASAASNSVTPVANYIEAVFSTWLYTGTGASQTITNGIDLSGKGGLVWTKSRSNAYNNALVDTTRGGSSVIVSNNTDAASTSAARLSFSTTGYDVLSTSGTLWNGSGSTYVSWTFREQPKFFDVVTYTGNGVNNTLISHNLGSTPGCVIVKRTDAVENWAVFHRGSGVGNGFGAFSINSTGAPSDGYPQSIVTSTTVNVSDLVGAANSPNGCNVNGATYVMYLFAHNAGGFGASGTDNVISCGAVTLNGSGQGDVTLGYEPQWILYRRTDSIGNWSIVDNMRGWWALPNQSGATLFANGNFSESDLGGQGSPPAYPNSTGFLISGSAGQSFIYIAIRRGPMATPTVGTSVFSPNTYTGNGSTQTFTNTVKNGGSLVVIKGRDATFPNVWYDQLRGAGNALVSNSTSAALQADPTYEVSGFTNNGFLLGSNYNYDVNNTSAPFVYWQFVRAPGFFDVVCYTGTGSATTFTHNLGVVPEMMIVKQRNSSGTVGEWWTYHTLLGNTKFLVVNATQAEATFNLWNNTSPTSTVFSVSNYGGINASGSTYVAYLFATVAGVSKVGSYTGTGALQTINCAFTTGARFVLIKRTDSTGDWFTYDSSRGITSGNDPYLLLNSTAAETTGTNYVDTTGVGFQVTAAAPAGLNAVGGTYIFLAIA